MQALVRYQLHISLNVIIIVSNISTQYYMKYEKMSTHSALVNITWLLNYHILYL